MKKIAIIMGSDSDLPVAEKAINVLASYAVPYEVHVFSAHRTPVEAKEFTVNARENGFGAIIALAGMAAHLAGAIAANTTLPVVGVPVKAQISMVSTLFSLPFRCPPAFPLQPLLLTALQTRQLFA